MAPGANSDKEPLDTALIVGISVAGGVVALLLLSLAVWRMRPSASSMKATPSKATKEFA